jgi:uncharacterized protein
MGRSEDSNSGHSGKLSRREILKLGATATAFTFLQCRAGTSPPSTNDYLDKSAAERTADRDGSLQPPMLIDMQTHVFWRDGGVRKMSRRGEAFLKGLAGSRAGYVKGSVSMADLNRVTFLEDVFMDSETDIAFLNSFGMRAAFDGEDLFPPREAAMIRSMAPARVRVLGTVDPPDGQSAVESLAYQCETLKIDGLKLYPPGPDTRGWKMDDEKLTYPLYEVLRKNGVQNICVHKGLPGSFIEE